jgi:hypothetical protein
LLAKRKIQEIASQNMNIGNILGESDLLGSQVLVVCSQSWVLKGQP